jgi:hypothetical protein
VNINSSQGWLCGLHTSSSSSSSSSKKAVAHAAAAAAAAPAGHRTSHGSLSTAHGPSSYELAAEKMSDREILSTLAQHLWPKGRNSSIRICSTHGCSCAAAAGLLITAG